MMAVTLTAPDPAEVLRYMGTPMDRADAALLALVEECADQLLAAAEPRWSYRVFCLSFEKDGVRLDNDLLLPGRAIYTHLAGCGQACVFCATLGAGVDKLIRQAACTDMTLALTMDCCASAMVEQLCDRIERLLQDQFPGCYFPYRFSPGYGDLPLEVNTPVLERLDAPRTMGLCATASHLLTPRKSVTAILGVADRPVESHKRSCMGCSVHDNCQYRKSGGHCGIS